MEFLQPGMELLTNSDLTEVTVEGDNRTNLEILVRQIGYANTREFPTPGRRNLRLTTTVTCDNGKPVKVPDATTYVMVLRPQTPSILLNGTGNMARKYEDFRMGVRVLADIHISGEQKLDKCQLSIYPNLNPDHENLSVPEVMLKRLGEFFFCFQVFYFCMPFAFDATNRLNFNFCKTPCFTVELYDNILNHTSALPLNMY